MENLTINDKLAYLKLAYDTVKDSNKLSFNSLINKGISKIITTAYKINKEIKPNKLKNVEKIIIDMNFSNVKISKPMKDNKPLTIYDAKNKKLSYSGNISVDINLKIKYIYNDNSNDMEKIINVKNVIFGKIPVMYKSCLCNLNGATKEMLLEMEEDPIDNFDYFILKEKYVIMGSENIKFNSPRFYLNRTSQELIRCEYISQQRGGSFQNSGQVKIYLMNNFNCFIEITNTNFIPDKKLPFHYIYKILGLSSPLDIVQSILKQDISNENNNIQNICIKIIKSSYDKYKNINDHHNDSDLFKYVAEEILYINNVNINYSLTLLDKLDNGFFPHIGNDRKSRSKKIEFISFLIYKMCLVYNKLLPETDRDALYNKRIHHSGICLSKPIKTLFNQEFIKKILTNLQNKINSIDIDNVDITQIENSIKKIADDTSFTNKLERYFTTGMNKLKINNREITSKIVVELYAYANSLSNCMYSRTLGPTSNNNEQQKTSSRAEERRRVHCSINGFICPYKSNDSGGSVGIKKEMTCTCFISGDMDYDNILEDILMEDEDLLQTLVGYKVLINGKIIGSVKDKMAFVNKYKNKRREIGSGINYLTSIIHYTSKEIEFRTDAGRMITPFFIVHSNFYEHIKDNNIQFKQYIKYTSEIAEKIKLGAIDMEYLLKNQIIEYISADEAINVLLCDSIEKLIENKNNPLVTYTHCAIEQQMLGLSALMSPFANHTLGSRVTLQTNHSKHCIGWPTLSYSCPDFKEKAHLLYNQYPIADTVATVLGVIPGGQNVIVMYSLAGYNQEDSIILRRGYVDRGGFACVYFNSYRSNTDRDEIFINPINNKNYNIISNFNYEKLTSEGIIKKGSIVNKNDVLISKFIKSKDKNSFNIDKSTVYNEDYPGRVYDSRIVLTEGDTLLAIVQIIHYFPAIVGDKLSSRAGCKGIISKILPDCDMPVTEYGLPIDMIINPHSIPTRMSIGQMIEGSVSRDAINKGSIFNATGFLPVNLDFEDPDIYNRYNHKITCYNNYGEKIENKINVVSNYYLRLDKYVETSKYITSVGSTLDITGQPKSGRANDGSAKLGEMETWAFAVHGANNNFIEKAYENSDRRLVYMCDICKNRAIYDEVNEKYECINCGPKAYIKYFYTGKSTLYAQDLLGSAAINLKLSNE